MRASTRFALFMTLGLAVAAAADILELRIVTTDGRSAVSIAPDGVSVDVYIQGRLSDPGSTDGLALWYTDIRNDGTLDVDLADTGEFQLAAPEPIDIHFDRDYGYCNPPGTDPGPSGYSGTASGANHLLWQVGGAQNTTNNTSPPTYPTGSVLLDVANDSEWTDLATGTIYVDGEVGDTVVLQLDGARAATIDAQQQGPVYAVSPAATIIGDPLTITVAAELIAALSVGYHKPSGSWVGGDVPLPIHLPYDAGTHGLSEPRKFNVTNAGRLRVNMTFDENLNAENVVAASITPSPGANVTFSQISGNVVELQWSSDPVINLTSGGGGPQYAYRFELGGEAMGAFDIAFINGDVNCDGVTDGFDKAVIQNGANWFLDLCYAANPRADVNRSGVVDGFDLAVVQNGANWLKPSPTAMVQCD